MIKCCICGCEREWIYKSTDWKFRKNWHSKVKMYCSEDCMRYDEYMHQAEIMKRKINRKLERDGYKQRVV